MHICMGKLALWGIKFRRQGAGYRVQGVPFIIVVEIIVLLETIDHDHDHDSLHLGKMRPKLYSYSCI